MSPDKPTRDELIAWARNPAHCATARCAHCGARRPVDEFTWSDGTPVGT